MQQSVTEKAQRVSLDVLLRRIYAFRGVCGVGQVSIQALCLGVFLLFRFLVPAMQVLRQLQLIILLEIAKFVFEHFEV